MTTQQFAVESRSSTWYPNYDLRGKLEMCKTPQHVIYIYDYIPGDTFGALCGLKSPVYI